MFRIREGVRPRDPQGTMTPDDRLVRCHAVCVRSRWGLLHFLRIHISTARPLPYAGSYHKSSPSRWS